MNVELARPSPSILAQESTMNPTSPPGHGPSDSGTDHGKSLRTEASSEERERIMREALQQREAREEEVQRGGST